jgi:DNA-binding transcriptional LysR family regulator
MHEISDMAVFARVIVAGSFSAAARELNLSPAVVSKRIARLEERLDVQLLNRTTRELQATEEGAAYYEHCSRILAEIEEAEAAITEGRVRPHGTLKITASASFGRQHIAPAITDFTKRYPEIHIRLNLTDSMIDLVKEGMDLAIRIGELKDSSLIARKLATNHRVVCASPEYLKRYGEPKTPLDLQHHDCIVLSYPGSQQNDWFEPVRGQPTVRVSGTLECDNGETIKAWVRAGLGVALKSTWDVGDDLRTGRLKAILTRYPVHRAGIYVLYPPSRHLPVRVRIFIDFLVERFGPEPYWDKDLPFC